MITKKGNTQRWLICLITVTDLIYNGNIIMKCDHVSRALIRADCIFKITIRILSDNMVFFHK